MQTLSDEQMQELALSFSQAASAIGLIRSARLAAGVALKDPTMIHLQSEMISLTNISSQIALTDANLALEDADKSMAAIAVATKRADMALETLKDVNKAVNIGAALIVLAAGISTGDFGKIAELAEDVFDAASAPETVAATDATSAAGTSSAADAVSAADAASTSDAASGSTSLGATKDGV